MKKNILECTNTKIPILVAHLTSKLMEDPDQYFNSVEYSLHVLNICSKAWSYYKYLLILFLMIVQFFFTKYLNIISGI